MKKINLFLLAVCVLGIFVGIVLANLIWGKPPELLSPVPSTLNYLEVPRVYAAESTPEPTLITYEGKVSHYSHAGCIGCSKNQVMGNLEKFDENAFTIAVPCELIKNKTLNYKMIARVTNLDTGLSAEARVTDCGGFSKYGRIADLSKGLSNHLKTKSNNWKKPASATNGTNVRVEIIK